jgi:hypothetical protein
MQSRAAGFNKDIVSELFSLLERTVEHKFNAIRISVSDVFETVVTAFYKITGRAIWRIVTSQIWSS